MNNEEIEKLWTWIVTTQHIWQKCSSLQFLLEFFILSCWLYSDDICQHNHFIISAYACLLQFFSRFFDLAIVQLTFRYENQKSFIISAMTACVAIPKFMNIVNVQFTFGYANTNLLSSLLCMCCDTASSKFQSECH